MKMKRLFPVFFVILVGLLSTQAYGDGFNPGTQTYHLAGPAIVGSATVERVNTGVCEPGNGQNHVDRIKFNFFGNCKGSSASLAHEVDVKICFNSLVAEDLEGFALPQDIVIEAMEDLTWPEDCLPKEGPVPIMVNTVTKFETNATSIHAEMVLLFLVDK
jgi:hypothetical protein